MTQKPEVSPTVIVSTNLTRWCAAALTVLVLLVAFTDKGVLKNSFIDLDDPYILLNNPVVRDFHVGDAFIKQIAPSRHFTEREVRDYMPLVYVSFAAEHKLFGFDAYHYHLDNLLLHLANVCLLFWLTLLIFRELGGGALGPGTVATAFLTAALFAVHPMNMESVAWVTQRKDMLATFFLLSSLLAYVASALKPRAGFYYILAFVLACGALLSKPTTVVLPLLLVAADYVLLEKPFTAKKIAEKVPFFLTALVIGLINMRLMVSHAARTGGTTRVHPLTALDSIVFYSFRSFIPWNLSPYYENGNVEVSSVEYMFVIAIAVALVILGKKKKRLRKPLIFGTLFFLIAVLPVSQLIDSGHAFTFADHYNYVPGIGWFLLFSLCVVQSWESQQILERAGAALVSVIMVFSFASESAERAGIWKDPPTFWQEVLRKFPNTALAHNNLGVTYLNMQKYDLAVQEFKEALKAKPRDQTAHYNLGVAYEKSGAEAYAFAEYKNAVDIDPSYIPPRINLGAQYFKQGRVDEAVQEFRAVLLINPTYPDALYNLGYIAETRGSLSEAATAYIAVLDSYPEYPNALERLKAVKARMSQVQAQ